MRTPTSNHISRTTLLLVPLLAASAVLGSLVNIRKDLPVKNFLEARERLQGIAYHTPLQFMAGLSEKYDCNIFVKREDLQVVRSYKIRGAYNKMSTTSLKLLNNGVVAASAGNHAQGVAFSCNRLKVSCKIFMPETTPQQKIKKVNGFGKSWVEIILVGINFDEAYAAAQAYTKKHGSTFVHPFNDLKVITGQGTVALEILEDIEFPVDYLFGGIGGGGFLSGVSSVFKQLSPDTKIIGVEPAGAASMYESLKQGKIIQLPSIDPFVDGCAVGRPGEYTYDILRQNVEEVLVIPEGKVCTSILELYNNEGIVTEPSGALTLAALDFYKDKIKGKTIVAVISGGNNDINRTDDIKKRSAEYEGRKKKEGEGASQ